MHMPTAGKGTNATPIEVTGQVVEGQYIIILSIDHEFYGHHFDYRLDQCIYILYRLF